MPERYTYKMDWFIGSLQSSLQHLQDQNEEQTDADKDEPLADAVAVLLDEFEETQSEAIWDNAENREAFEDHLDQYWGDAIEKLEYYIMLCERSGVLFTESYGQEYDSGDYQFDALVLLHARACRISREVLTLLRAGYGTGAMARWRAIYEIAAASIFISENTQDIAERFLDYQYFKNWEMAKTYREHQEELGFTVVTDEDWEITLHNLDHIVNKHGPKIKNHGGWYSEELGNNASRKDLAEKAGIVKYEVYFKYANNIVHGGSKGSQYQHGIPDDTIGLGPSAEGLINPAQLTALMLHRTVDALLSIDSKNNWQILTDALEELSLDVIQEFTIVPTMHQVREELEETFGDIEDIEDIQDLNFNNFEETS